MQYEFILLFFWIKLEQFFALNQSTSIENAHISFSRSDIFTKIPVAWMVLTYIEKKNKL